MTKSPDRKNLELSVTNLGPIAKAEIDLRPMTVFVGPSNTGKSYLAMLIYALHRFFSRSYRSRRRLGAMSSIARRRRRGLKYEENLSEETVTRLIDWIDDVISSTEEKSLLENAQLPDFVTSMVRPLLRGLDVSGEVVTNEMLRSFGVADTKRLIRHRSKGGLKVVLKQQALGGPHDTVPFAYTFTMKRAKAEFLSSIPDDAAFYIEKREDLAFELARSSVRRDLESQDDAEKRRAAAFLMGRLADMVVPYTIDPLSRRAYYLPADRTGIMHAHLVAVASLIERAPFAALGRDDSLPELSGVLADFLRDLVLLGGENLSRRRPHASGNLAKRLEERMLNGAVRIKNSITGYPEFSYQPTGWHEDMPLMNTSSMVSELAPVILYLRHVVRPDEVLIIEEPESHLHPAMQVEFIRHLAAAVRAGVRIMITTHSEWVLDALANLVLMSDLPKSRRKGFPGGDFALRASDVGVWLFEPKKSPKGSVVRQITFSADYGGYASDFNEVAKGTYNHWARVANLIEEQGEK